jgi:cyclopropane-fatty-acyl-phospholipid synthase
LAPAGIEVNGPRPFDLRVLNDAFYTEALPRGLTSILDAYVDGWWDSDQLDELVARVLSAGIDIPAAGAARLLLARLSARVFNEGTRKRARRVARHYDLGNDLFECMLDRRLVYSCGYWRNASNLADAQEAKLRLVAEKVGLRRGMRVLDIGCGFGGFAKYVAENYGVSAVGCTISKEQYELGKELCAGLPVELRLQDYRDLENERFDAVVSIGMFEHVGYKNYRRYMQFVREHLKPNGLSLLHTIGSNTSKVMGNPWIQHYVFPSGMLPSARQIAAAAEGLFVMEDWHNFGSDYDRTLMAWFENFDANWPRLRNKYGDRFYRMWKCYLLTFAGAFRARDTQLWQIVFSPHGVPGGYAPVR